MIRVCSYADHHGGRWLDLDTGELHDPQLPERTPVTHGLCRSCYLRVCREHGLAPHPEVLEASRVSERCPACGHEAASFPCVEMALDAGDPQLEGASLDAGPVFVQRPVCPACGELLPEDGDVYA